MRTEKLNAGLDPRLSPLAHLAVHLRGAAHVGDEVCAQALSLSLLGARCSPSIAAQSVSDNKVRVGRNHALIDVLLELAVRVRARREELANRLGRLRRCLSIIVL